MADQESPKAPAAPLNLTPAALLAEVAGLLRARPDELPERVRALLDD
mgnify:CR=1 FL=1